MILDPSLAALAVLAVIVVVLAAIGAAALRFGVDSRPGIGDRADGPWLVPTPRSPS